MENEQMPTLKRNLIPVAIAITMTIALGVAGYVFLYHPALAWQKHFEVFEDKWGIADPSYRNWTGKIKHIGPYPIRSAELVLELKDETGNVTYTGSKQLVKLSDPPMHPGNVKRFTILLKRTRAEKIDDEQTTYRVDIHKYQKKWF